MKKQLRLIELFSGIGAQAKALTNLGVNFEHYRSADFDSAAVSSYNMIHGTSFVPTSIMDIQGSDLGIVDTDKYVYMMTYSFPCQDLSNSGRKRGMSKGAGTRSSLLWEVERLLNECKTKPQVLVMENVTAVHNQRNFKDFMRWQGVLENLGYTSYYADLNAKDYGIPQSRGRCFMVSFLTPQCTLYNFPEPIELQSTWRDYLDLEISDRERITFEFKVLLEHNLDSLHLPEGYSLVTACKEPAVLDTYAACLTTKHYGVGNFPEGNLLVHKSSNGYRYRELHSSEVWRLMGFSNEDWDKCSAICTETQLYKQGGNSIVVNVLMHLFKGILEHLLANDGIEIT